MAKSYLQTACVYSLYSDLVAQCAPFIFLKRKRLVRFISLLIIFSFSMLSNAVVVSYLYEVQVEVASQSQSSRSEALNEALQQVLVKVSGNATPLQDEGNQAEKLEPDRYVGSYSYIHNPITDQLQLKVLFAQNLIDALLRQTQYPIWGRSRPLVLVWQAVEEKQNRFVINTDKKTWHYEFEKAMNDRGIPVIWPSLDLEDQMALPMANLWGLFRDDIGAASERYLTDAYMAGRLIQTTDGMWQYTGFFQGSQAPLSLAAKDESKQAVFHSVANQVASFLAQHYAVQSGSESSSQIIDITNVNSFQQYQQLLSYLQANSVIKEVKVLAAKQNSLSLELVLAASWDQAWSTLALDQRLLTTDQPQTYQWQP